MPMFLFILVNDSGVNKALHSKIYSVGIDKKGCFIRIAKPVVPTIEAYVWNQRSFIFVGFKATLNSFKMTTTHT